MRIHSMVLYDHIVGTKQNLQAAELAEQQFRQQSRQGQVDEFASIEWLHSRQTLQNASARYTALAHAYETRPAAEADGADLAWAMYGGWSWTA